MKFVRPFLCLAAAMAFLPSLQAQTAAPDAPKKPDAVKTTTTTTTTTTGAAAKPGATPDKPLTPDQIERQKVHVLVVMDVKIGSGSTEQILIELFPDDAPNTVDNFIAHVKKDFYKGQAFHRAIKDYLVQTGDPKSKEQTLRDQWGLSQEGTIPPEPKLPHVIGSVAMARRSDKVNPKLESDSSQFYIALGNLSALNGSYTVFGQVVSGLEVLKKISEIPTDSNDCPLPRIEITNMTLTKQKGPLVTLVKVGRKKVKTKPDALKGPIERFIERVW